MVLRRVGRELPCWDPRRACAGIAVPQGVAALLDMNAPLDSYGPRSGGEMWRTEPRGGFLRFGGSER